MTTDSLREILVADVPPAFVSRFIEAARAAYKEAWGRVENDTMILEEGRAQLLPHLRRVLLEAKMHDIALDCGLKAEAKAVSSGAHKYVAVNAGRLVMTCSKTTGRNVMPRVCEFRDQYSTINEHIDQTQLFPVPSNPGRESIYCIIAHGPTAQNNGDLGFCCFGFPKQGLGEWAQEPIALEDIRDYQQARYQKTQDEREQIQSVEPKLKPQYGAKGTAEEIA